MNATVRAVTSDSYFSWPFAVTLPAPGLKLMILFILVLFSALSVVYMKDLNRRLFINYQTSQQTTRQLNTDYGKLLLEESAWSTQARVQKIAEQKLAMKVPTAKDVVIVTL